LLKLKAKLGY